MKRISLALRLFAVASLTVAGVLGLVLSLGWTRILQFQRAAADAKLCMEARPLTRSRLSPEDFAAAFQHAASKLHLDDAVQRLRWRFEPAPGANANLGAPHMAGAVGTASTARLAALASAAQHSSTWDASLALEGLVWEPVAAESLARHQGDSTNRPAPAALPLPPPPPQPPALRPGSLGLAAAHPPPPPALASTCQASTVMVQGRPWRAVQFSTPAGRSLLLADLDPAADQLLHAALVNALVEVLALAVIATVLGAWLLTAVTLRPLQRLREAMRRMDRNALDQRLPHQNEDREFAELIGAYNTMLARLEASFLHASRFCADAAHELKTPLTVLQGRLELALNDSTNSTNNAKSANNATAEAQQRLDLATMQDEVRRLTQIMHRLLLLSQADAGQLPLQREAVDMSGLLEDMMDDVAMLDDARTLTLQIAPNLWVLGDALLLRQLLNNLASNAVRYGHPSGWIRASAWAGAQGLELVLANNTLHPVDAPLRERFFERFYRGTQAHHRHTEGSGLGLELAREIARAHGGELWLQTGTPAAEVWLHLRLPQDTLASSPQRSAGNINSPKPSLIKPS